MNNEYFDNFNIADLDEPNDSFDIDINSDENLDEFSIDIDTDEDFISHDVYESQQLDDEGNLELLQPNSEINDDPNIISLNDSDDTQHWHEQNNNDTCAIVAQEFVLDQLGEEYGIEFNEEQLRQEAIACGWYTPDVGTPLNCVGNLIEAHGVEVEQEFGCSLADLSNKLDAGQKVIVAIDSDEIYNDEIDRDDLIANYYGLPGQDANHAVQVVGVDYSDFDNPIVILNDPGTPDGKGLRVPAEDFLDAWEDSKNFMVATIDPNLDPSATEYAFDESDGTNNIFLGSISEGDREKGWGDYHKNEAEDAKGWADYYAKEGETQKALEYEKVRAEEQKKAEERYQQAKEEYQKE